MVVLLGVVIPVSVSVGVLYVSVGDMLIATVSCVIYAAIAYTYVPMGEIQTLIRRGWALIVVLLIAAVFSPMARCQVIALVYLLAIERCCVHSHRLVVSSKPDIRTISSVKEVSPVHSGKETSDNYSATKASQWQEHKPVDISVKHVGVGDSSRKMMPYRRGYVSQDPGSGSRYTACNRKMKREVHPMTSSDARPRRSEESTVLHAGEGARGDKNVGARVINKTLSMASTVTEQRRSPVFPALHMEGEKGDVVATVNNKRKLSAVSGKIEKTDVKRVAIPDEKQRGWQGAVQRVASSLLDLTKLTGWERSVLGGVRGTANDSSLKRPREDTLVEDEGEGEEVMKSFRREGQGTVRSPEHNTTTSMVAAVEKDHEQTHFTTMPPSQDMAPSVTVDVVPHTRALAALVSTSQQQEQVARRAPESESAVIRPCIRHRAQTVKSSAEANEIEQASLLEKLTKKRRRALESAGQMLKDAAITHDNSTSESTTTQPSFNMAASTGTASVPVSTFTPPADPANLHPSATGVGDSTPKPFAFAPPPAPAPASKTESTPVTSAAPLTFGTSVATPQATSSTTSSTSPAITSSTTSTTRPAQNFISLKKPPPSPSAPVARKSSDDKPRGIAFQDAGASTTVASLSLPSSVSSPPTSFGGTSGPSFSASSTQSTAAVSVPNPQSITGIGGNTTITSAPSFSFGEAQQKQGGSTFQFGSQQSAGSFGGNTVPSADFAFGLSKTEPKTRKKLKSKFKKS